MPIHLNLNSMLIRLDLGISRLFPSIKVWNKWPTGYRFIALLSFERDSKRKFSFLESLEFSRISYPIRSTIFRFQGSKICNGFVGCACHYIYLQNNIGLP